jgi:hypothetical protein
MHFIGLTKHILCGFYLGVTLIEIPKKSVPLDDDDAACPLLLAAERPQTGSGSTTLFAG